MIGMICDIVKEAFVEILLSFPIDIMPIKKEADTNQPSKDTGTHNLLVKPINHVFFSFIKRLHEGIEMFVPF